MSNVIGKSAWILQADTTQLESGIAKAKGQISNFANSKPKAGGALSGIGGGASLGGGFVGATGPLGMALAAVSALVTGLKSVAGEVLSLNDQFINLSNTFGTTVETISQLNFAGKMQAVSLEAIGKGMKNLAVASKDPTKLASVGLSESDLTGDVSKDLGVFADALNRFEGLDRATKGLDLFGKSFLEVDPLLQLGSKGMKELTDKADSLGITATTLGSEKLDTLGDAFDTFGETLLALGREALTLLAPTLTVIFETLSACVGVLTRLTKGFASLFDSVSIITTGFQAFFIGIIAMLETVGLVTSGTSDTIAESIKAEEKKAEIDKLNRERAKQNAKADSEAAQSALDDKKALDSWLSNITKENEKNGMSFVDQKRAELPDYDRLNKKDKARVDEQIAIADMNRTNDIFNKAIQDALDGLNSLANSSFELKELQGAFKDLSQEQKDCIKSTMDLADNVKSVSGLFEKTGSETLAQQMQGLAAIEESGTKTEEEITRAYGKLGRDIIAKANLDKEFKMGTQAEDASLFLKNQAGIRPGDINPNDLIQINKDQLELDKQKFEVDKEIRDIMKANFKPKDSTPLIVEEIR